MLERKNDYFFDVCFNFLFLNGVGIIYSRFLREKMNFTPYKKANED